MMYKKLALITIVASLSACATHAPIIDTDGVDMSNYLKDFQRCQEYQKQVKASWKSGALAGAVIGGAAGSH